MDWDLWIGKLPDKPDRAIVLYDSGGRPANPRWLLDFPSFQVRVRGNGDDYKTAYDQLKTVKDYLLGVPSYTASNNDRIVMITAIGDIAFVGWDENKRPAHVMNFSMTVEPYATGNEHREAL